jgi:hypothetical protein
MVNDVAGVLPPVFFKLLLEIVRKTVKQLARRVGGATAEMDFKWVGQNSPEGK